jgi:hypothetical protein
MFVVLKDMLLMLGAAALLWVLHLYARVMAEETLLGVWAVGTVLIAGAFWWRRRIRRRAFLSVYIAQTSFLQRLLRGGLLMAILQLPAALLLAAFLLLSLVRLDEPAAWVVLILAAPTLVLLRHAISLAAVPHLSTAYRPEASLRLTLPLLGLPLLVILILLALQRSYPDFSGVGLERAVWHVVAQEQARSEWLLTGLQIAAAGEALRLWLAQQLLPALPIPLLQWFGWIVVFVREALFVWSYLLLMQGFLLGGSAHVRS